MNTIRSQAVLLAMVLLGTAPGLAQEATDRKGDDLWIDALQGEPVQYETMLADLAAVDVVYLGERHTLERHHAIQARILADLAQKGNALALGLEQMETSQQAQLDRYGRGEIDFDQLAQATDWPKRWRNHAQYRSILEAARARKIPIVALNERAETIREIARSGSVERLPPELRGRLPATMRLQDPAYEKLLSLQMMVHVAATPQRLRGMIEAQIARDEVMAQTLAVFLKSTAGRGRKMLVLCGSGHVAYGLGMPARVRRHWPEVNDRVVLLSASGQLRLSAAEQAQARDIEITHQQLREIARPIADYLGVQPLPATPRSEKPGLP